MVIGADGLVLLPVLLRVESEFIVVPDCATILVLPTAGRLVLEIVLK